MTRAEKEIAFWRSFRRKEEEFSLQVIENMERETGIEPATNSLEDCQSIENE
jgi:hypothetical protein